jgi:hypothetical protein
MILDDKYPIKNANDMIGRTIDLNFSEYTLVSSYAKSCNCTRGILARLAIANALLQEGGFKTPEYKPVVSETGGENFRSLVVGVKMSTKMRTDLALACKSQKIKAAELMRRCLLNYVQEVPVETSRELFT